MLSAIGAILFLVLASTVATLATEYLPESYGTGIALLLPLIGFNAARWAFMPERKRKRKHSTTYRTSMR
jgi:hypothetical protein